MRENNAKTSRFFHLKKFGFPLFSIFLAIFSYSLLIPFLGFYSDDVSMIWISQRFGTSALFLHYLTNRPFLGFLATPLIEMLGFIPWHYQIFYFICRLVCAFSVFWLVGLIWPKNTNASIFAALIFLLYPGYTIWPQAVISSRHIILLIMFICSLGFSVLVIRYPSRRRIWLALAILLGILNLLLSDYFVFLEFIRPILLWVVLSEIDTSINKKLRSVLVNCGALWIAFCLIMYWRLYCFPNLENWYHISVFSNLQTAPIPYLFNLLLQIIRDLWTALGPGMIGFFGLPDVGFEGRLIYLMAVIGLLSLGIGWLVLHKSIQTVDDNRRQNISMIAIGFLWLLFSGPVFWAVGIVPTIEISASRFLLSFLLGVCLVFAGILSLIPNRHFTVVLLSLWIGVAVAGNIRTANYFRLDWVKQQRLYTQIAERIPDLEPGTMIISEELGTILPSSTFLSAYVNWLYDQTSQGFPRVTYYFDYLAHDESVENIIDLFSDQRVLHAYPFTGNQEQIVGMTYINNCFVVLDPELDPLNPYIAQNIQEISSYSRRDMILPDRVDIPSALRFTVNENTVYPWCLAFLQADLASQFGQWESVVEIADSSMELFPLGSSMGRFFTVFIEGYAHTGRVSEAVDLTASVLENYPETNPMLCRLWDRILLESGEGLSIGSDPVDTGNLFNCQ